MSGLRSAALLLAAAAGLPQGSEPSSFALEPASLPASWQGGASLQQEQFRRTIQIDGAEYELAGEGFLTSLTVGGAEVAVRVEAFGSVADAIRAAGTLEVFGTSAAGPVADASWHMERNDLADSRLPGHGGAARADPDHWVLRYDRAIADLQVMSGTLPDDTLPRLASIWLGRFAASVVAPEVTDEGTGEDAGELVDATPGEVASFEQIADKIAACQRRADEAIARRDYEAAEIELDCMERLRPGIPEARTGRLRIDSYRRTEADISGFVAAARSMLDAGRYWDAEDNVRSAERFDAILPPPASPQVAAIVERYDAVRSEYARFVEPLRQSWSAAWDREDWDGCLEIFRRLEVRPLNPEDAGWVAIMRPELERMRRDVAAAAAPTAPPVDAFTGVFGQWDVRLNGQPFVLEIGGTPGSMTGALAADAGVEPLDAVSFDDATSTLRFARPIGGGLWQLYTGSLAGRRLEGFFETGALAAGFEQGAYRYSWNGEWRGGLEESPLAGAAEGSTAPQDQQGVFGQWDVLLNVTPFLLEIGGTPGNMTGALYAGAHVEPLDAVSFDAATSTLRFARPIGGGLWQLFSGVLDGGRLTGFFEAGPLDGGFEQGTYRWTWSGERPQR